MNGDDDTEAELFDVFVIGTAKYPNDLHAHLQVNPTNLNGEFSGHAERFAWYATAYELASDVEMRLKEELARLYARLDAHTRQEGHGAGVKLTEKMVENTVITHASYIEAQEKYLDAKRNAGLLRAAKDSMVHRKDMLVQLGANYRAEGGSDISLKQDAYVRNK